MREKKQRKFKKGAASFYVVAFSTLVLVIIAASFTAIIISEMTRSSNDDLAQSAYDSALAGIEDAKIAYNNYHNCLEHGGSDECNRIIQIMDTPDCDMVGRILGRISDANVDGGEIKIQETKLDNLENNMQQAYTCVKIETSLSDYRATLSSSDSTKLTRIRFDGVNASEIKKVKISWGVDVEPDKYKFSNIDSESKQVKFPAPSQDESSVAVPPVVAVSFLQTSNNFSIHDFNRVIKEDSGIYRSNRGSFFLVPTNDSSVAGPKTNANQYRNYIGACNGPCDQFGSNNVISMAQVAKTNDKSVQNYPFVTYCPENSGNEFICSTMIELPEPIGGSRNNDTFIFVVSIPYGKPATDYSLEFFCADDNLCYNQDGQSGGEEAASGPTSQVNLRGVQIRVDSTGRANDLVRRVETRMEGADDYASFTTMGPLELLGTDDPEEALLNKDYIVTSEPHSSNYYNDCFEKVLNRRTDTSCPDGDYQLYE